MSTIKVSGRIYPKGKITRHPEVPWCLSRASWYEHCLFKYPFLKSVAQSSTLHIRITMYFLSSFWITSRFIYFKCIFTGTYICVDAWAATSVRFAFLNESFDGESDSECLCGRMSAKLMHPLVCSTVCIIVYLFLSCELWSSRRLICR